MTVEIKKMDGEEWNIIHTHKSGFVKIMTLESEEVKELIEEFKEAGVLTKIEFGKYGSDEDLWYILHGQYLILATRDEVKDLLKQMKEAGF